MPVVAYIADRSSIATQGSLPLHNYQLRDDQCKTFAICCNCFRWAFDLHTQLARDKIFDESEGSKATRSMQKLGYVLPADQHQVTAVSQRLTKLFITLIWNRKYLVGDFWDAIRHCASIVRYINNLTSNKFKWKTAKTIILISLNQEQIVPDIMHKLLEYRQTAKLTIISCMKVIVTRTKELGLYSLFSISVKKLFYWITCAFAAVSESL